MRSLWIIAFLLFILVLTGYVCWHLWRITPHGWKWVVVGLFLLWMASMFAGFKYMESIPVKAACVLYEVGNTWLIAFMYLAIVFFLADIASLCHILPKTLLKDSALGLFSTLGIVALILTLINAEKPDLVLFGGDIIDRSLRPVIEGHYEEEFRRIDAPVMTVFGNHESFVDTTRVEEFFQDAGIVLLRDSVVHFKGVDVIGRYDRSFAARGDLGDISAGLSGFTLVLDHQPVHLEEAEQAGIDFQFSGHTHHGQVWPISWFTDLIFEKAWGRYRKGDTQYYISSGLGLWGAKVRVGTRSEYLVLKLVGKE